MFFYSDTSIFWKLNVLFFKINDHCHLKMKISVLASPFIIKIIQNCLSINNNYAIIISFTVTQRIRTFLKCRAIYIFFIIFNYYKVLLYVAQLWYMLTESRIGLISMFTSYNAELYTVLYVRYFYLIQLFLFCISFLCEMFICSWWHWNWKKNVCEKFCYKSFTLDKFSTHLFALVSV